MFPGSPISRFRGDPGAEEQIFETMIDKGTTEEKRGKLQAALNANPDVSSYLGRSIERRFFLNTEQSEREGVPELVYCSAHGMRKLSTEELVNIHQNCDMDQRNRMFRSLGKRQSEFMSTLRMKSS